jgi:hypothetical protein
MTRKETGFLGRNISEEYKKALSGPMAFAIHLRKTGLITLFLNVVKM